MNHRTDKRNKYRIMLGVRFLAFFCIIILYGQGKTLMAQACTGCVPVLPPLPADTIYYTNLPSGSVGVFYDATMSIRVPLTTTPINAIDPGTPAGLTISSYTVLGVTGMPPGLSSYVSQSVIYPANNPDICIRVCGTPLVAGNFAVQAQVVVAIGFISQNYNLTFNVLIEPASVANNLFELDNVVGCGSLTTNITNLFTANGQSGIFYNWNFGNGQTSTAEQPGSVTFSQPGNYDITLNVTVDTVGYLFQSVTILSASCSDNNLPPFSYPEPDLFIEVFDANNTLIFVSPTSANVSFPFAVGLPSILMQGGNYKIKVWDEDLPPVDPHDLCGEFVIAPGSNGQVITATTGATLTPTILNPVFNYAATSTVVVHPLPVAPTLSPANGAVCANSLQLSMSPQTGTPQWYLNNQPIITNGFTYTATQAGNYNVTYFDSNGCASPFSNTVGVQFLQPPVLPTWNNNGFNMLVLDPGLNLPASYSMQWYYNNAPIDGATTSTLCITSSGNYSLTLTNLANGCSSTFTNTALYNPTLPCINHADEAGSRLLVAYPNPTTGLVSVFDIPQGCRLVRWYDSLGRLVDTHELVQTTTYVRDLSDWITGIYTLVVYTEDTQYALKVVKF